MPTLNDPIDGFTMQACYVKYIDQGRVMGTAGGPKDAIFIQDLYTTSRIDSDHVPEPLPAWFLCHIQANSDTYPLVIREIQAAKDWGVHADVQRYYCCDSHLCSIEEEITTLQAQSKALCAQLSHVRFHLENADVPHRFSNLQALAPTSVRQGRDGNDPSPEPIRYQRTRTFAASPVVGLHPNWRVMIPAVSSGQRMVDGYVRVGPNQWSRRSDIRGDVA